MSQGISAAYLRKRLSQKRKKAAPVAFWMMDRQPQVISSARTERDEIFANFSLRKRNPPPLANGRKSSLTTTREMRANRQILLMDTRAQSADNICLYEDAHTTHAAGFALELQIGKLPAPRVTRSGVFSRFLHRALNAAKYMAGYTLDAIVRNDVRNFLECVANKLKSYSMTQNYNP
jgi:hypothetical protein